MIYNDKQLYSLFLDKVRYHRYNCPFYPSYLDCVRSGLPPPKLELASCHRSLLLIALHIPISLLTSLSPSRLDIPPARTAAAQAKMYQPPKNAKRSTNPHEREHLRSHTCADIQSFLGGDDIPEDDEHDGCDDCSSGSEESRDEHPDSDR